MPEKRPVEAEPAFSQFEADREQVFQYLRQDFPVLQYSNYFVAMSPFCSMVVLTGIFIPYPPLNTLQGYRDFFHRGVGSNFAGSEIYLVLVYRSVCLATRFYRSTHHTVARRTIRYNTYNGVEYFRVRRLRRILKLSRDTGISSIEGWKSLYPWRRVSRSRGGLVSFAR